MTKEWRKTRTKETCDWR